MRASATWARGATDATRIARGREHNDALPRERRVGIYGLDVYSLWDSMHEVVTSLERVDPDAAREARRAYRCFEPYGESKEDYARATALVPTRARTRRSPRCACCASAPWNTGWTARNASSTRGDSYEAVLHHTGIPDFLLPFAERGAHPVMDDLREPRGHRAIGVVYHPELERHGNYVPTTLPGRYDAFISLDETRAVAPLHMPVRVDGDCPRPIRPGCEGAGEGSAGRRVRCHRRFCSPRRCWR